jgi:hypothetical protein
MGRAEISFELCKLASNTTLQVDAMGSGDKRVIGLHIAVQD